MASCAVLAKSTAMHIVAAMTIITFFGCICRIARFCVAGAANQALMLAGQREGCLLVMVKAPGFPVGRVVTIGTGGRRAKRAAVMIVSMA